MENESPSKNQSESSYLLKLAAVLIILGAVWFGSSFTKNRSENQTQTPPPEQNLSASTLPAAQDAFLIPITDAIIPIRKWTIREPELSALSVYALETSSRKILLEKQADQVRPIASLSKLMTALIIFEKDNFQEIITVSKDAIDTYGEMGNLVVNEKISIESLMKALLIESSNDAAVALADKFNGKFVELMNQKAKQLGLKNTRFSDPSGLNIDNLSNAGDLIGLIQEVIKYPILTKIMHTPETDISSIDGKYSHHLTNSNKLLGKYPEIIVGKTGYIDEAGGCMILALKSPNGQGMIINVILASQDRLADMERLILWEKQAFIW